MIIKPPCDPRGLDLLLQGSLALAEVERVGMAVDVPYLHHAIKKVAKKSKALKEKLLEGQIAKEWKAEFGNTMNLESPAQLGKVLFDRMKFPHQGYTTDKRRQRPRADVDALSYIPDPWIQDYVRFRRLSKASGTYLKGILREEIDGRIHPSISLNIAKTFRPSTSSPNTANVPQRDPEVMQLVRRAFTASDGRQLVEIDFKVAEVTCGCAYHKDPSMIAYVTDPTKDMHRDAAAELFLLDLEDAKIKPIRHSGKNQFVFPEFYGSVAAECGRKLWKFVLDFKGKLKNGMTLKEHLKAKGITTQQQFEKIVTEAERRMWQVRFPTYAAWKDEYYRQYQKDGYFVSLTGFTYQGYMDKNDTSDYSIQGSAFHCLLWVLIRLVKHELLKRNMKTRIVNQVYDCVLADTVPSELDDFVMLCRYVIENQLAKAWKWIVVPITAEVEVSPIGSSWADKQEYHG